MRSLNENGIKNQLKSAVRWARRWDVDDATVVELLHEALEEVEQHPAPVFIPSPPGR